MLKRHGEVGSIGAGHRRPPEKAGKGLKCQGLYLGVGEGARILSVKQESIHLMFNTSIRSGPYCMTR